MELKNIKEKELVISLIKDDLTNIRLVSGLEKLGLDSGNYYLHLSETIFKLMGLTLNDNEFCRYMEHCRSVNNINIFDHPERVDQLAHVIYNQFLEKGACENIPNESDVSKELNYLLTGSIASMKGLMNLLEIATSEKEILELSHLLLFHTKMLEIKLKEAGIKFPE